MRSGQDEIAAPLHGGSGLRAKGGTGTEFPLDRPRDVALYSGLHGLGSDRFEDLHTGSRMRFSIRTDRRVPAGRLTGLVKPAPNSLHRTI